MSLVELAVNRISYSQSQNGAYALILEEIDGERASSSRDLDLLTDDSILGNSDKMLFHMKELVATIEDPNLI